MEQKALWHLPTILFFTLPPTGLPLSQSGDGRLFPQFVWTWNTTSPTTSHLLTKNGRMLLFPSTQDVNLVAKRRRETGVVRQANKEHLRPSLCMWVHVCACLCAGKLFVRKWAGQQCLNCFSINCQMTIWMIVIGAYWRWSETRVIWLYEANVDTSGIHLLDFLSFERKNKQTLLSFPWWNSE